MLLGIHDAELINDLICIPSWGYGPFMVRNNIVFSIMRLGVTYTCKISLPIISGPIMHAKWCCHCIELVSGIHWGCGWVDHLELCRQFKMAATCLQECIL